VTWWRPSHCERRQCWDKVENGRRRDDVHRVCSQMARLDYSIPSELKLLEFILFFFEFCYGVSEVPQRYQSFSLISIINFYYIINKLIILVSSSH
jgi:hypothetical protein